MKKVLYPVIVLFFLTIPVYSAWNTEVVDNGGDCGKWACLRIDSGDMPHIVCYSAGDSQVRYANKEWDQWQFNPGPTGVSGYVSMDLDNFGHPRVTFVDGSSGVNYVYFDGSWSGPTWLATNIQENSIAVDDQGYVYVVYHVNQTSGGLYYKTDYDPTPWTQEEVAYDASNGAIEGRGCSLAIHQDGNLYVSYVDQYNYVICKSKHRDNHGALPWTEFGSGRPDANSNSKGSFTCLALNIDGVPYIAYTSDAWVRYAYINYGAWYNEPAAPNGGNEHFSLVIGGTGKPHIAFADTNESNLKYAYKDNGVWRIETIEENVGAEYPSIRLDSQGKLHVAYYDSFTHVLKYAVREEDASTQLHEEEIIIGNNKFNPADGESCRVMYNLVRDQDISIYVLDLTGNLIKIITKHEFKNQGPHSEDEWDGRNQEYNEVASGIYYIVVDGGDWKQVRKVAIVKGEQNGSY